MPPNADYEVLPLLLELARRDCIYVPRRVSKVELAKALGVSPWKLNKLLRFAEEEGYIERKRYGRSSSYQLTARGLGLLQRVHAMLSLSLRGAVAVRLKGVVVPGIGEGAYYMSIPRYLDTFEEILGFRPYAGTLNVKLDEESTRARLGLRSQGIGYRVEGFVLDGKEFCGVTVYKAVIVANGISVAGAALDIDKTKHGHDILELIAPVRLRDVLNLRDGDSIEVIVLG